MRKLQAFTLIELSIVLVIIGLIVGGVLVGRDLISSSAIKAQVSQLQQYDAAVNTFRDKFGGIPGDLSAQLAAQFGFVTRAGSAGRGDGDGLIAGLNYLGSTVYNWTQNAEAMFFWEDLSTAKLIKGAFSTATDADVGTVTSNFGLYYPEAKIGNGNYVYVYSGVPGCVACWQNPSTNYYGISIPASISVGGNLVSNLGMTVAQSHHIDTKMDDGLPVNGRIIAQYSAGGGQAIKNATNAGSDTATTCYNTGSNEYSITTNNGTGVNCALSFQFQ